MKCLRSYIYHSIVLFACIFVSSVIFTQKVHATTIHTIGNLTIDQNISDTAQSIDEKFNPTPNLQTGAFQYGYQFYTPPGRAGLTPSVSLSYSSQGAERINMVGEGWNLGIPYIQRSSQYGNNTLYQSGYNEFISSIDGELLQVSGNTTTGVGEYRSTQEQGAFVSYTFTEDNQWLVVDQIGNRQTYGQQATARQENGGKTYSWYIEELQDTNGNTINYTYVNEDGVVYVESIKYGSQNISNHPFEIRFLWEEKLLTYQEEKYYPQFLVKGTYRLAKVQTYVDGTKIREFALEYNDTDAVFYLHSITESGFNKRGEQETKPPVLFDYDVEGEFNSPTHAEENVFGSQVTFGDFNGDAIVDAIKTDQDTAVKVNINKGHQLDLPESELQTMFNGDVDFKDVVILDINGDGTDDIIGIINNTQSVTASIVKNGQIVSSWSWSTGVSVDGRYTLDFQDMNGDGLSDVLAITNDALSSQKAVIDVYFNNGNGFDTQSSIHFYNVPAFSSYGDVNSDGLVDYIYYSENHSETKTINAQLATRPGVFNGPIVSYDLEHRFRTGDFYTVQASDLTMDGKNDLIITYKSYDGDFIITELFANKGNGFGGRYTAFASESASNHYILRKMSLSSGDYYLNFIRGKINEDLGNVEYQQQSFVQTNKKLLQRITHQEGGQTEIDYKPASHYYTDEQERANTIPYATYLVDVVTSTDGVSQTYTTTYNYRGGEQWFQDGYNKQFASFSAIEITNSEGEKTINYFHQGNGDDEGEQEDAREKIGRPYKQEIYDNNNQLFQRTRNIWGSDILTENLGPRQDKNRSFVYLEKTITESFDGNSDHKDTAIEYITNTQNGNSIQETDLGDVVVDTNGNVTDIGSDDRISTYTYATKEGIETPFVSQVTITNEQNQKVAEQNTYYDDLAHGIVDKGNVTKEEQWITGNNYINTQTQYNSVGLPTRSTDANGNDTSITYDRFTLYPETITNELGHQTQYEYNIINGEIARTENVTGIVVEHEFDGFGRVIRTKQSDIDNPNTLVTIKKTIYTDGTSPRYIRESVFFDEGKSVDTLTFFDRFGRVIQTKKQGEKDDLYITQDYTYEELSTPHTQTLPYYAFGSSYTPPTTNENLTISQTYDALGRVVNSTNIIGSTNQAYDERITTVTDANGNEKSYEYDVRGNLITVREQEDRQTFTTNYTYDIFGNLMRITDAEGNIRNFTYDGLSRKIYEELLHTAQGQAEKTVYQYDNNGNIIRQTNPDGQIIVYTYDELNRVTQEYNVTDHAGTLIEYRYDSCQYGIGLLCVVNAQTHTDVYGYDTFQRPTLSIRTVNGVDYISQVTYDYIGTPKTITHTDGTVVSYQFNAAGQVSSLNIDGEPLVTGITYAPNGQIEHITYANGVETTNTYDQNALYRLINKTTLGNEITPVIPSSAIQKSFTSEEDLTQQNEVIFNSTDDGYITVQARAQARDDDPWVMAHDWDGEATQTGITVSLNRTAEFVEGKNIEERYQRTLSRGYFTFDTGVLPDNAHIIEADLTIHVEPGNQLSPSYQEQYYLTTIDMEGANKVGGHHYDNFLSGTGIGSINLDSLPLADEYEVAETDVTISLNSQSARDSLNVVASTTFSLVHVYDLTNRSFSSNTTAHFSSFESPGTENDPRLRIVYVLGEAPTAPTDTKVNNVTNPTNLFDKTPEFTAIHHDPDVGDLATRYQIQVADENGNFTNPIWDSGIVDLAQPVREGEQSITMPYGGERLQLNGQTYTYRIKFFERFYYKSPWSETGSFTMATIDNEPVHINCANALYGEEHPQALNCTIPVFNILNNTGNTMQEVIIEVADNASFSSPHITHQTVTVLNGERTGNIVYTGNRFNQNQTYYVRTAFVDTNNTQTSYSATHTFTLANREILQDIDYLYDLVGNIVELHDNQEQTTSYYEYDDLYRLTRWTLRNAADEQIAVRYQTYSPIGNILSKSNVPGNYQYAS
ncbi:MAG: hypothetical protein GW939_00325, partial [Candidatus Magasanikbacteria bacterium]|nr:hypothetical protein [Candidatus Magasanikbacteria bacterium]